MSLLCQRNHLRMNQEQYQIEVLKRLIRVANNANRLLGKLGTRDHPVESHYQHEFERLDLAVVDLYDFIKK